MDYSYDFAKIKANYPEKIGLEQMRVICHISKKTARYLLTSGLVPCIDTGKKTANTSSIQKMLSRILKSVNPNRKNSRHRPGITQRAGTKAASPKR